MKLQAETRRESGRLLEVRDLHTHFSTPIGLVKSVDHVSFDLDRGHGPAPARPLASVNARSWRASRRGSSGGHRPRPRA